MTCNWHATNNPKHVNSSLLILKDQSGLPQYYIVARHDQYPSYFMVDGSPLKAHFSLKKKQEGIPKYLLTSSVTLV